MIERCHVMQKGQSRDLVRFDIDTHTHNRFTAGLEYVRVHLGQQVPER